MPALLRGRVLPVLLLLGVLAAACGGGDAGQDDEDPGALVRVGTEAWEGSEGPGAGTGARSEAAGGTAGEGTDPTAQLPVVPGEGAVGDAPGAAGDPAGGGAAPPVGSDAGAGGPVPVGADVEVIVASMSLEQKVGQLFAVAVVGDDATDPSAAARSANTSLYGVATPAEVVATYHLGGVAYLDHDLGEGTSNVDDIPGVASLSAGLQRAAAADTGIGLLIGADQEGGRVVRLREPATVFPAAREVGDAGDLALAESVGRVIGTEALALGINWVFAPVADVNANPANPVIGDRAFGTTTEVVVPFARATAAGIRAAGALPTLKHYPGHGDTTVDSHSSLPTIDHDRATLDAVDLPPFVVPTAEVLRTSVMVGHLAVPALDPSGRPATISRPMIDLLRGELGFAGLVVTDAMNMGALEGFGDAAELAVQAITAGIDVVLMPTDLPGAWAGVLAAARDGRLPMATVDAAVTRVLATKQALGVLDAAAIPAPDPSVVGAQPHRDVLAQVKAACGC